MLRLTQKAKSKRVIVALLSVSLVSLTTFAADLPTDITGVTGVDGIYNIKPEDILGNTGFRHYENFNLSEGDIANLIFKYGAENVSKFVNFVDNTININGIVNAMRDGNFVNGHAIFVSPNGMVVGASGVLNVGSLSVLTPSTQDYTKVKGDMFAKVGTDNALLDDLAQSIGNGKVQIDGKVLARNLIDINAATVALGANANIIAGVKESSAILNSASQADALFNQLVKTGISSADSINNENGSIKITTYGSEGMSLDGKIVNLNGDVLLENKGGNDIKIKGLVESKGIDIKQKDGNVVIGDNSSDNNYLTSNGDININIENGSLLNAGVAKTLLTTKNGGNLNINVTDGTIGMAVPDGIGPDARDLTKSINANIDGTYTASSKVSSMNGDTVINLAALDSDMKLNSIKSDGKVYLLADSSVKGEKSYSILNAAVNSNVPNIESKGFSLIASGDIGISG